MGGVLSRFLDGSMAFWRTRWKCSRDLCGIRRRGNGMEWGDGFCILCPRMHPTDLFDSVEEIPNHRTTRYDTTESNNIIHPSVSSPCSSSPPQSPAPNPPKNSHTQTLFLIQTPHPHHPPQRKTHQTYPRRPPVHRYPTQRPRFPAAGPSHPWRSPDPWFPSRSSRYRRRKGRWGRGRTFRGRG